MCFDCKKAEMNEKIDEYLQLKEELYRPTHYRHRKISWIHYKIQKVKDRMKKVDSKQYQKEMQKIALEDVEYD